MLVNNSQLNSHVLAIFNSIHTDLQINGKWHETKVVRQNPDGGYADCRFPLYSFQFEDLSEHTKDLMKLLLGMQVCISKRLRYVDFDNMIKAAFCREFTESLMISYVWDAGLHNFQSILKEKASEIENWFKNEDLYIRVRMRIFTELPKKNIPEWEYDNLTIGEKTLLAHRSGISSDEFLSRLFHSSSFFRELRANETKNQLMLEVDKYIATLSLALWRPIHLDDLYLEDKVWKNSPFIPFTYMRMHGAYKYSGRDASSVDFHSSILSKDFAHQVEVDWEKFYKVKNLINAKPELLYPVKKIFKGLYLVLSSTNEPEFVSESQAFDGLHDIFIGLDGMIGEPPKGVGHRKFFEQMWRKILNDLNIEKSPRANSNNKIVAAIYDLRCELAHGTNHTVHIKVRRLKTVLGDNFNPGLFDSKSLGFSLNIFLNKVFTGIILDTNFSHKLDLHKNRLNRTIFIIRLMQNFKKLLK